LTCDHGGYLPSTGSSHLGEKEEEEEEEEEMR